MCKKMCKFLLDEPSDTAHPWITKVRDRDYRLQRFMLMLTKVDDLRSEEAGIQREVSNSHNLDLNRSGVAVVDQDIALCGPGNWHDRGGHGQQSLGHRVQPSVTDLLSIDFPGNPVFGQIGNIHRSQGN